MKDDKEKQGTPCPDCEQVENCKIAKNHPYCDMNCPLNITVENYFRQVKGNKKEQ